jgi:diguanylate cyclase (GGDEF)-like protein
MRHHFGNELLALWNGDLDWSGEGVNYALDGTAIDIRLHWRILPGSERTWKQVLVTIEDISARKQAERRFEALFEFAPISMWEEDYSAVKAYFDDLRRQGVTDIEAYFDEHPQAISHCMSLIHVLDVNRKTLELFGADSKQTLFDNLPLVFRDEMGKHFRKELADLWNGKLVYDRDGVNYSLNGEPVDIHLDFRIMPGYEQDFRWASVAIQDITARKKAEEYLRYLGTHDVMTGVYNRTYFEEILVKLERERKDPISVIIADLNGLKSANDTLGHQAGDNLIRRAAEVLKANEDERQITARIGGDEFAIFLIDADEEKAAAVMEQIQSLVALNNKYYGEPELSISLGAATSQPGLLLERVISMADNAMYLMKNKRRR